MSQVLPRARLVGEEDLDLLMRSGPRGGGERGYKPLTGASGGLTCRDAPPQWESAEGFMVLVRMPPGSFWAHHTGRRTRTHWRG